MQLPRDILGEAGGLSGLLADFAPRAQQLAMAEAIDECIGDYVSFICEAGTGTGKTFAYLVPALLSGQKVIISTGTRHLQDQLFEKDLPLVREVIGKPLNVALLKGRANYLCIHRLQQTGMEYRHLDKLSQSHLSDIRVWAKQTTAGDLGELGHIPEDTPVRPLITSTTDNCLGQECEHYQDCFVFKARKHAVEADLVVINHHLFLADMALKEAGYGDLLPRAEIIIFDEAHQLPDLASQFFSETLSYRQMKELITDSKAAYLAEAADLPDFLAALDAMETAIKSFRLALQEQDNRVAWHDVKDDKAVKKSLADLQEKMFAVYEMLQKFAERGKALDNCYRRIDTMQTMLDSFNETGEQQLIQWLEMRGKSFFLHQTPLDIASTFQQRMTKYNCINIYTSATLAVNNNFEHFADQLGLQELAASAWDSPFDFQRQALLYLPTDLPDPRSRDYTGLIVEKALPVLELTRGRAFFLFTSHRALKQAAELLSGKIDYPILVQGEAPKTELLETFRNNEHSVLLGTSSFWEGVDVKGQALSCVIIDKLPFASPDDPVLSARMKQLQEQGRNPFMDYQVPEAVINLKQGIGRLLRDQQDYGVLMICDPRLTGKPYGKVFLRSLPVMPQTAELTEVERFFLAHENRQS
ncbi:MAG: ATP-dependent DNA helicase [Gammaproteobacteria bacterium]